MTGLLLVDLRVNPLNADAYNNHIPQILDNNPDVVLYYDPLPVTPGDFNEDGAVDTGDYTIWADNYTGPGGTVGTPPTGDANGDGAVDTADYTIWADNYTGASAALNNVPEPSTMIPLVVGAFHLLLYRRKR